MADATNKTEEVVTEVVNEEVKKEGLLEKVGGFFKKHKTKFLIGGALVAGAAIGAAGMYANTISEEDYLSGLEPDDDEYLLEEKDDEDDSEEETSEEIE